MANKMNHVITRFAPSPTGNLHIGSARTALFNWLYARHHNGTFLIRIEDTDKKRSDEKYTRNILSGLNWLGLDWKYKPDYQSQNINGHKSIAYKLLNSEKAYIDDDGVVRLKAVKDGVTTIDDIIQGPVTFKNDQMDDMALLRSDGSPTYMLACVVDDYDTVTHVIRGDDHLNNAFRQMQLYNALDWTPPKFAHIPLIHTASGKKMSKRSGEAGLDVYRDMGIPASAMLNYLLRLGWSYGDKEIFTTFEAIHLFNLENIGKSPAKFDVERLKGLGTYHIHKKMKVQELMEGMAPFMDKYTKDQKQRLMNGLPDLKTRSKNLVDLADSGKFYCVPQPLDDKAKKVLNENGLDKLNRSLEVLETIDDWNINTLKNKISEIAGDKSGPYMHPLRAALTGKTVAPGVFEIMNVLGKEESIDRIRKILKNEKLECI